MDGISSLERENATNGSDNSLDSTITKSYDNETLDTINYCPYIKSPISNLILVILYSVVCIVGIVGNSLVIFVVLKFKWVGIKIITSAFLQYYLAHLAFITRTLNNYARSVVGWKFFFHHFHNLMFEEA